MEHLLRDIKDNVVGSLSTQITNQLNSLKGLESRLEDIRHYLDRILSGAIPVNHQIIYNLQDVFNLLPNLDYQDISKAFSVKTNDELLVVYLSSLIRAVIATHNLINNKISNRDAERKTEEQENGKPSEGTKDGKDGEGKENKNSTGEGDKSNEKQKEISGSGEKKSNK